jgi:hypothetical protein
MARLRESVTKIGFPLNDRLYQIVSKAYDEFQHLSVELHYLSCEWGWGDLGARMGLSPTTNEKLDPPSQ